MVEEEVMLAMIGDEEEEGLGRRVVEINHSVTRMRGKRFRSKDNNMAQDRE